MGPQIKSKLVTSARGLMHNKLAHLETMGPPKLVGVPVKEAFCLVVFLCEIDPL